MSELFEIPESLSPRERWVRRHHITIECQTVDGQDAERWTARYGPTVTEAPSRDEAIWRLARQLEADYGIPNWR